MHPALCVHKWEINKKCFLNILIIWESNLNRAYLQLKLFFRCVIRFYKNDIFEHETSFTILSPLSQIKILEKSTMTFSINCWVVRKKRTMGRRKPMVLFKERQSNIPIDLPKELQSSIFDRMSMKDQSKAMCVSHSWRDVLQSRT